MLYSRRFVLLGGLVLLLLLGTGWALAPWFQSPTPRADLVAPSAPAVPSETSTTSTTTPTWQGGALSPQDTVAATPAPGITPVANPSPRPNATPTPETNTSESQTNTSSTSLGKPSCSNGMFDICAGMYDFFVNNIVKPVISAFNETLTQVNNILWRTPAKSSYDNDNLKPAWNASLWLVNLALAGVLAWAGLRYLLGSTFSSWLSYADLIELLPRLAFGLAAAYCSLRFCGWIIDISNALCSLLSTNMLNDMTKGNTDNPVTLAFQVIYIIMGFLLLLEEGARYAVLYILIAFSPLWMFAASLRETAGIAKAGVKAFVLFTLVQPAQIAVMMLGGKVITAIVENPAELTILNILVGLGIMLIALLMFLMVAQQAMGGLMMPFAAAATGLTGLMASRTAGGIARGGTAMGKGIGYGAKKATGAVVNHVKSELGLGSASGGKGTPPSPPTMGSAGGTGARRSPSSAVVPRPSRTPYTGKAAQTIAAATQQSPSHTPGPVAQALSSSPAPPSTHTGVASTMSKSSPSRPSGARSSSPPSTPGAIARAMQPASSPPKQGRSGPGTSSIPRAHPPGPSRPGASNTTHTDNNTHSRK